MFAAGWFLAREYFAPNISADPGHGWRIPILAGCGFAVIAICINMEKAAPRSIRELKVIAVCAVLYSVAFASLFAVAILDCIYYPSALNFLAVGLVLYVLQRCWRLGRDYEGGLDVQAMQRGEALAFGEASLFEILVVEVQVERNLSVGRRGYRSTNFSQADSRANSTAIPASAQAKKLIE